jgi:hypothetical protein
MPLNLAQTAISVLRLGENALTAIYSGIVRVYPNEVTVSIDGANASTQSGTPGQSMNNLIYTVNPSSGSTSGWTAAQISAATLTGLPAGFTATFSASGGLGSQVGTWTINTTDGLLPAVDTAIAVGSLTSTIAQTGWGSINVSIQGLSYWNNGSGTITGFVGSTGSVGASGSTVTVIGVTIATLGTGSVNSSVSVTSNNFPATNTANVIYEIPGPPWNVNPTSGVQCFTTNYYQAGTPTTDGRIQTRSIASWTGTSSGSVTFAGGGISGSRQPQSYQNNSMRPGSGSYTITTESNFGQSNSGTYVTQNSVSWNWN